MKKGPKMMSYFAALNIYKINVVKKLIKNSLLYNICDYFNKNLIFKFVFLLLLLYYIVINIIFI